MKGKPVELENEVTEIVSTIQNILQGEGIEVKDIEQWTKLDDHEFAYTDDEIVELIKINDKEKQPIENEDDKALDAEIEKFHLQKLLKLLKLH